MRAADRFVYAVLLADSVILAVLEVFFLPLRFDGRLLPDWGSWPFPVTALLAAVANPWLVVRAADLTRRMLLIALPLVVWLLAIGVVGTVGVENAALLPDWRTLLLIATGTLPTAIALGNVSARLRVRRAR